jgi:hypothetical protein
LDIPERFTREVELERTGHDLRSRFQLLETEISSEPFAASLACEPLNRTVLVTSQTVLHYRLRAAKHADCVIERLDNDLSLNFVSEGKRELNRPDVLALRIPVHMVWT